MAIIHKKKFAKFEEPEHGLVIVDSSVLKIISHKVDPQYLTRSVSSYIPERRWADGLLMLAENGFKVAIPQMVAYECSSTTLDGCTLKSFFPVTTNQERDDLFDKAYENSREFLSHLRTMDNPDATIEPPNKEARSAPAIAMNRLNEAIATNDIHKIHKIIKSLRPGEMDDYGDIAALDMVKSLPENWSKPVFYICADRGAVDAMREARPDLKICMVNVKGYMAALRNNGLFTVLGIDKASNINSIVADITLKEHNIWRQIAINKVTVDLSTSFIDTTQPQGIPQDNLFSNTVNTLRQQLPEDYIYYTMEEKKQEIHHLEARLEPDQEKKLQTLEDERKAKKWAKFSRKPGDPSPTCVNVRSS